MSVVLDSEASPQNFGSVFFDLFLPTLVLPVAPAPGWLLRRERDDAQSQLDQLTSDRRQLQDDKGQLLRELAGAKAGQRWRAAVPVQQQQRKKKD